MAIIVAAETPAGPNNQTGSGITYGQLNRKHPNYNALLWERLRLLYEGGYEILSCAHMFVPKYPLETDEVYAFRLKQASYIGLLGKVIGYLVGSLFTEALSILPEQSSDTESKTKFPDDEFYKEFFDDCDLQDTDFSQFIRVAVTDALVCQKALIGIDFPPAPAEGVTTLAQEDQLNLRRGWLYRIHPEAMINWHSAPRSMKGPIKGSEYLWCVIKGCEFERDDPLGDLDSYRETFKIWRMVNGVAHWEKYRTKKLDKDTEPKDTDELERVQELRPTSFRSIPIEEILLPKELWAGNLAGPMCEEHFRDRSMLKGDMARSLHEIPYVKQGPEIPAVHGALPSDVQTDPNRGRRARADATNSGWVVVGKDDELAFAGPSGTAHELTAKWLETLKDEVMGVVNAMALNIQNSSAALDRSGESKAQDRSSLSIVLGALAYCAREGGKRVLRHIIQARGENVAVVAAGLNTFDADDRTVLLAEGPIVEGLRIPSPTFQRIYKKQLALALVPRATPEQKADIDKEIEANVSDEESTMDPFERAQKMAEAQGKKDQQNQNAPPGKGEKGKKSKGKGKGAKEPMGEE